MFIQIAGRARARDEHAAVRHGTARHGAGPDPTGRRARVYSSADRYQRPGPAADAARTGSVIADRGRVTQSVRVRVCVCVCVCVRTITSELKTRNISSRVEMLIHAGPAVVDSSTRFAFRARTDTHRHRHTDSHRRNG